MWSTALKGLFLSSFGFLISASIGAQLAMAHFLPARFGGLLSGHDVAGDFLLLNGTALSPDLALMLLQIFLTGCALRRERVGMVGVIGLTVLGACYTLGQLGEPITLQSLAPATFIAEPAAVAVANIVCSSALFAFGFHEWRSRALANRDIQTDMAAPLPNARRGEARAGSRNDDLI